MNPFIERHQDSISGVLSCFDRVIITGTLPDICHAGAMGGYLGYLKIRLFDYPRWAEPLREELRENAERLAAEAGLKIEFIRKLKAFRKEARIKEILAERGDRPGLVHIFSAMESCSSYQPWHDKSTHRTFLKPSSGKCLHYYFYFSATRSRTCTYQGDRRSGVLPPVPYRAVRWGQPRGAERPGHCSLRLISGQPNREGMLRLPASWRSGARVEGYGQLR
jgi:hypothetical protein